MATARVNTSEFEKGVQRLIRAFGAREVLRDAELVAEEILKRSINAPIPSDTRFLANSAATSVNVSAKTVTFGFNRAYAAFQDSLDRKEPYRIRPKRARWIYVPISQRGRRHRVGANPESEGLILGGFVERAGGRGGIRSSGGDADYILAKEVIVPIKRYGSAIGPNKYFSETVRRNQEFALEALAARLERRLGQEFSG